MLWIILFIFLILVLTIFNEGSYLTLSRSSILPSHLVQFDREMLKDIMKYYADSAIYGHSLTHNCLVLKTRKYFCLR